VHVSGLRAGKIVSFDLNFGVKNDRATNVRVD